MSHVSVFCITGLAQGISLYHISEYVFTNNTRSNLNTPLPPPPLVVAYVGIEQYCNISNIRSSFRDPSATASQRCLVKRQWTLSVLIQRDQTGGASLYFGRKEGHTLKINFNKINSTFIQAQLKRHVCKAQHSTDHTQRVRDTVNNVLIFQQDLLV